MSSLNVLYTDYSGKLGSIALIPYGTILMWTGTQAPPGWAICNGLQNTPDLRGRFILGSGQGSGLTERIVNTKGGTESVSLDTKNLPPHEHYGILGLKNLTSTSSGNHKHAFSAQTEGIQTLDQDNSDPERNCNYSNIQRETSTNGSHNHSFTVNFGNITSTDTGNGKSHNNIPPYYALCFIMKI